MSGDGPAITSLRLLFWGELLCSYRVTILLLHDGTAQ